jgi:hypothetical protein
MRLHERTISNKQPRRATQRAVCTHSSATSNEEPATRRPWVPCTGYSPLDRWAAEVRIGLNIAQVDSRKIPPMWHMWQRNGTRGAVLLHVGCG